MARANQAVVYLCIGLFWPMFCLLRYNCGSDHRNVDNKTFKADISDVSL